MTSLEPPTRVRYGVLAFLCGLTFLLYLDRMSIGQSAPFIQQDLALTDQEMGLVFAAFTVAYGLFEVVTGHLGDRHGSRGVLTRIVVWWSVFTTATGMASGFVFLLAARFLFGVGEAGALPNAVRVTETWFPPEHRGAIRGLVNVPALVGGMVAPPLTAYLIQVVGWRWVFGIYGLAGVVWAVAFWSWFRDRPADHPGVNAAEIERIGPPPLRVEHAAIPWRALVAHANVWLLGGALIAGAATVYTLFSWYPSYLKEVYRVSDTTSGWLNGLVMLGGALGCLVGGWAADQVARTWRHSRWKRSSVGATGFGLAAVAMLVGSSWGEPLGTSIWFAVACFGINSHAAAYWGVAGDIGGRHIAALFAVINSIGALGAAGAQLLFGYVPRSEWGHAFAACGGLLAVGTACWALVDSRLPVRDLA